MEISREAVGTKLEKCTFPFWESSVSRHNGECCDDSWGLMEFLNWTLLIWETPASRTTIRLIDVLSSSLDSWESRRERWTKSWTSWAVFISCTQCSEVCIYEKFICFLGIYWFFSYCVIILIISSGKIYLN